MAPQARERGFSEVTETGERIQLVDALRGFALLGIFLINIRDFDFPLWLAPMNVVWTGLVDRWTESLLDFFVNEKFYSLFSLLFGIGFGLQLHSAMRRGKDFIRIYSRRLLGLALIGIAHGIFLWWGDVLFVYAVLASALLLLHRLPLRWITAVAVIFVVAPIALSSIRFVLHPESFDALPLASSDVVRSAIDQFRSASYVEGLHDRLGRLSENYRAWIFRGFGAQVLGMFFLGFLFVRIGLIQNPEFYDEAIRRVFKLCVGFTIVGLILWSFTKLPGTTPSRAIAMIAFEYGKVLRTILCIMYAAGAYLIWKGERFRRFLRPISAAGRMALTNYIMQSVLASFLFSGYGLGWYGQISPFEGILLALGLFSLQVLMSIVWLRRFRMGPIEWIWRSWTYGRWQPLQLKKVNLA